MVPYRGAAPALQALMAAPGLENRVETSAGSFFDTIPQTEMVRCLL
jgi:hypothetical protein